MASTKSVLSVAASLAASAMLVRTIANDFMPYQIQHFFFSHLHNLLNRFSSQFTIVFEEYEGLIVNQIYEAADLYLGTKISPSTRRLRVSKSQQDKSFNISMERNEELIDMFEGIQLKWRFICTEAKNMVAHHSRDFNSTLRSEVRSFELCFHKKHKEKVMNSYLPYILKKSKEMKEEKNAVKLYTVNYEMMYGNCADAWSPINLDHPATFETLAMDSELKRALMEDLERFLERKDFYRRVGKAWKRGYLLYGPPGTGKSSLIAAMANFLNFDIYDLELTEIQRNTDLRKLLVSMANRSILIVEDIDCTIELQDQKGQNEEDGFQSHPQSQVTLSGLLNFMDGLWSSCGDERIIVFTTNHKDRLDPALLRPGRMDMHIHMSYCTPSGFEVLASNYLNINNHQLFDEIQGLIQEVEITPAQIAEELMRNNDPEIVLQGLIEFLHSKKMEAQEPKVDGETEVDGQGKKLQQIDDNLRTTIARRVNFRGGGRRRLILTARRSRRQ
ncbi:AAA-ATPase At3g50940-like [Tasmannia lanceolata]|uniref:AAA-ATPase At3g50940-like n=1 Tax=Tasmannia lanceolata TaxID=3420 RepID=UPI0040630BDE